MCLICNSTEQTVTQIVMRGKRVGIVETCGKKLAQKKKRTNVFFVSETNLYIYTVISAHGQNTELNLTPMNSNGECLSVCVCVSASVGGSIILHGCALPSCPTPHSLLSYVHSAF